MAIHIWPTIEAFMDWAIDKCPCCNKCSQFNPETILDEGEVIGVKVCNNANPDINNFTCYTQPTWAPDS